MMISSKMPKITTNMMSAAWIVLCQNVVQLGTGASSAKFDRHCVRWKEEMQSMHYSLSSALTPLVQWQEGIRPARYFETNIWESFGLVIANGHQQSQSGAETTTYFVCACWITRWCVVYHVLQLPPPRTVIPREKPVSFHFAHCKFCSVFNHCLTVLRFIF